MWPAFVFLNDELNKCKPLSSTLLIVREREIKVAYLPGKMCFESGRILWKGDLHLLFFEWQIKKVSFFIRDN